MNNDTKDLNFGFSLLMKRKRKTKMTKMKIMYIIGPMKNLFFNTLGSINDLIK